QLPDVREPFRLLIPSFDASDVDADHCVAPPRELLFGDGIVQNYRQVSPHEIMRPFDGKIVDDGVLLSRGYRLDAIHENAHGFSRLQHEMLAASCETRVEPALRWITCREDAIPDLEVGSLLLDHASFRGHEEFVDGGHLHRSAAFELDVGHVTGPTSVNSGCEPLVDSFAV